jgi:Protein of unknown function (DUF3046)
MRHTEFWDRMDSALGKAYARTFAEQFVVADLGSRTVNEALGAGVSPKEVWRAVHAVLELPENQR